MKNVVLTLVLSVFCIGNVSAQKWLKSLGKVLDKAEQVIQGESNKTVTQNDKQTSSSKNQSNKADYTLAEVQQVDNSVVATPVDLGLSVQWASKNLGAAQPFQYGGYYDRKADYLSQYWGEGWRLPTEKEWEELFTKCKVKYVTAILKGKEYMPDIAGYLMITGPNGNKMWLPAAGFKNRPTDKELNNAHGSEGFYWAFETRREYGSTVYSRIFFQADEKFRYYPEGFSVWGGASIRPVFVGKGETMHAGKGEPMRAGKEEPMRAGKEEPMHVGKGGNEEPEKEPKKDTNPILSTYSTSSEEPLVNGPENMVAVDPEGKDSPDKKDEPEINLPKKLDNITKELLTNTVKVVLAKRATYTIIRRGIFFTDERMQGNPLNHSYSFYKAMHDLGAFRIQEIDASKLASNSNIMSKATKHSSYPIAGTKCITITHIDKNLIRGMRKGIYGAGVALSETNVKENETGLAYDMNNIATYEFPNQFYELVNISDSEGYKFENGNILLTLVCDVIENPSDFSVALMKAYNKAYTPITGLTYDIPQAQKIIIAIDLHFDAGQKKWSYKGTYKKNMTTNKFELLYQ